MAYARIAAAFDASRLVGCVLELVSFLTAAVRPAQFAYLVAFEPLDRAMLVGAIPAQDHVIATARTGLETFLARYGGQCRQASPKPSTTNEEEEPT